MAANQLAGSRVLIVEDEYYLADDARSILSGLGMEVVGPVATAPAARALIETGGVIDMVLLDVNLRGELAFDVADTLKSREIPFAFISGYDRTALPGRFADVTLLEKPVRPDRLVDLCGTLVGERTSRTA